MESRRLPDWIDAYMKSAGNLETSELIIKWSALSAIASALRRRCSLMWDRELFANMFVVIVAPAAWGRKGTAMNPLKEYLREAKLSLAPESLTKEALIQELTQCTESYEVDNQLVVHSSLTVFSTELAVFITPDDPKYLSYLTNWYDCEQGSWTYRTVGRKNEEIPGICLNLLGATTPKILKEILPQEAVSGGLTSRIIFVYAQTKGKSVPLPFAFKPDEKLKEDLMVDFQAIASMKGRFVVTEGFIEEWVPWYMGQEANPPFDPEGVLGAYLGRRATHLLKLCMIVNASRTDKMVITRDDFIRAKELLGEVERLMPLVFEGYGRVDYANYLPDVIRMIKEAKRITYGEVLNRFMNNLTKFELDQILEALTHTKAIKIIETERGRIVVYAKESQTGGSAEVAPELPSVEEGLLP